MVTLGENKPFWGTSEYTTASEEDFEEQEKIRIIEDKLQSGE